MVWIGVVVAGMQACKIPDHQVAALRISNGTTSTIVFAAISLVGLGCFQDAPTPVRSRSVISRRSSKEPVKQADQLRPKRLPGTETEPVALAANGDGPQVRGIWITTDAVRDWELVCSSLKQAGLNSIFVRVGRGGNVIYPSALLAQDEWSQATGRDELAGAVSAAHRHGLSFHAWKVCFHMGSARRTGTGKAANQMYEWMASEDRLVRNPAGKQGHWLNPSDPRNQQLEIAVAREIVSKYSVDGYHLDYIRYPDSDPGFDYHYGEVSRLEFENARGRPLDHWPDDVITGPHRPEYEAWERSNITNLVRKIGSAIDSLDTKVIFSAAVWRNIHRHRDSVKQDWPVWAEQDLLDLLIPMDYTKDADGFRQQLSRQIRLAGTVPLAAGIGSWQLGSATEVLQQIRIADQLGTAGFVLFSYNAAGIKDHLTALRDNLKDAQRESTGRSSQSANSGRY